MSWTYHNDPAFRVSTTRFFAVIGTSPVAADLYALRREVRRHLRLTSVYESAAGIADPVDGRIAIVGRPYRAWTLRELLSQLRRIGLTRVAIVVADTQTESEAGLIWQSLADVLDESVATPAAQVGEGVLDAAGGAAEGLGAIGAGLGEGLPALGRGAGELAGAAGAGVDDAGDLAQLSPLLTLVFVGAVALAVFAISSGALKFAPIKVGG